MRRPFDTRPPSKAPLEAGEPSARTHLGGELCESPFVYTEPLAHLLMLPFSSRAYFGRSLRYIPTRGAACR